MPRQWAWHNHWPFIKHALRCVCGPRKHKEQGATQKIQRYKRTVIWGYRKDMAQKKRLLQGVTNERSEERMAPARLRNGLFGSGQQS